MKKLISIIHLVPVWFNLINYTRYLTLFYEKAIILLTKSSKKTNRVLEAELTAFILLFENAACIVPSEGRDTNAFWSVTL